MTLRARVSLLVAAVVALAVTAVGVFAVNSARAGLTEEIDQDLRKRATLVTAKSWKDLWTRKWRQKIDFASPARDGKPIKYPWPDPAGRTAPPFDSAQQQDPLGPLVSFDAYARIIVNDSDSADGGEAQDRRVVGVLAADFVKKPDSRRLERARREGVSLDTISTEGQRLRLMTVNPDIGVFVQVARPLEEVDRAVANLRNHMLLFGVAAVAVAAAGAWLLAGPTVRPIVRLTETAERIASTGDFGLAGPEDADAGRGVLARDRGHGGAAGIGLGRPMLRLRRRRRRGSEAVADAAGRPPSSEVGRLTRSFRTMLAALSASREQQHRLVADASHELRTPLTSLRTNVELLRRFEDLPPDERAAMLDDIDAELRELTDLVAELVDLAADTRSDEPFELVEIDELVGAAVERARRQSRRDGIELRVERRTALEGRPDALARAVRNLLDNAVKFGGEGPVEVVVDGGAVTVHDSGAGVPEADRERIFERFHRLPAHRDHPGSGLGLAIVRQIAEAHGGSVHAGPSPLGGAAVGFRVPGIDENRARRSAARTSRA